MRHSILAMFLLATMAGHGQAQGMVVINDKPVTPATLAALQRYYGQLAPGNYWYDPLSGLWGPSGGAPSGQIMPGLDLGGAVSADASHGDTKVFVNGREIPQQELRILRRYVINLSMGRYWLDSLGNLGKEGGPAIINLYAIETEQSDVAHQGYGVFFGEKPGFTSTW